MFICLLYGLVVLIAIFLVPQGTKLFRTTKAQAMYKYVLFGAYTGGILWLTLVKRWGMEVSRSRFQPFYVARRLLNCWFHFKDISTSVCKALLRNSKGLLNSTRATPVEDLFLNIILFIPLGFLLPYAFPKLRFWKTVCLALLLSVFIETVQYVAQIGCCDIDDVINNTLGACIGYICFWLYTKLAHQ